MNGRSYRFTVSARNRFGHGQSSTRSNPVTPTARPAAASVTILTTIVQSGSPVTMVLEGTSVSDRATVSGSAGTPTGSVTFSFFNDGTCSGTPADTTTGSLSGGVATSGVEGPVAFSSGSDSFSATYNGDGTYLASTGACEPLGTVANPNSQGWVNIGPSNINTGSGLHSSQAGVVADVGFAPSDPNTLYVASGQSQPVTGPGGYSGSTGEGGVYKSSDGGQTWKWENQGLAYTDVTAIAVNPLNSQMVVIEVEGPVPTTGFTYKSVDGGNTWQETYAAGGYGLNYVGTTLYATTFHALLASSDFGSTWRTVSSFPSTILTSAAVASGGQTIYVGTWHQASTYLSGVHSDYADVLKSSDGGQSFSPTLQVSDVYNPSISQIVINPGNVNNVFVMTSSPFPQRENGNPGLYESSDAGTSWSMIDDAAHGFPNGSPVQYVAINPQQANTVYASINGGIYVSSDDGASFSLLPNFFFDIRCVIFNPDNAQQFYVGTDQGLYVTQDGGSSFTPLNNWPGTLIYDIAVQGTKIFTTVQDMSPVYSPDGGKSWTIINTGEEGIVSVDPYNPNVVVMWTEPHVTGFFWVSNDGGSTFTVPQIDETAQASTEIWTASGIAFASSGAIYLAGGAGIFQSLDLGQTWTLLPGSPTFTHTVAVSPSNPADVYASNWNGTYASTDSGATWTLASTYAFNSMAIDPANSQIIVGSQFNPSSDPSTFGVVLHGSVLISTDGGVTFTTTSMSSNDRFTTFPQIMFAMGTSGPVLIYTCQEGVYASTNLGTTWHNLTFNLPMTAVDALTLAPNGTAYIATYGAGVWTFSNLLATLST